MLYKIISLIIWSLVLSTESGSLLLHLWVNTALMLDMLKEQIMKVRHSFNIFFINLKNCLTVPGEPDVFEIVDVQNSDVFLGWNRPSIKPWCVER